MVEWLKNNVSVVLTIITMAGGGYGTYIRIQDQLALLQDKVLAIETNGTEKTRTLEGKVRGLEQQNNELALQMKEQREVLNKIDKRVGYLLCKTEKRFCVD